MAEQARRLLVVAHGPTAPASDLVLGDERPLVRPEPSGRLPQRLVSLGGGPEPACRQTLELLGGTGQVLPALAGPDLGAWRGRRLTDVAAADPAGFRSWLSDPDARPHGGETLTELVHRLTGLLEARDWPAGTSALVVTPLVARALTVAALAAPAAVVFALDIGHAGRVLLSGSGHRWRLQELRRPQG